MKYFFVLVFSFITLNAHAGYKIHQIETTVENTLYKGVVFQPVDQEVKYILLITPNIAGLTGLEWASAAWFSERGYLVLATHNFDTEMGAKNPDTAKADSDYNKFAVGAGSLLTLVEEQFKTPPGMPVFALGASQGAVGSIIIASQEPRIKALWTAVGGGDLPYIYAHSLVPQVLNFKINHKRVLGIKDDNEYEAYLRANLKNDPSVSCQSITVPFHQTIAMYDDLVPTQTQQYLVDKCPPHKTKYLVVDHIVGSFSIFADREDVKTFFESSI